MKKSVLLWVVATIFTLVVAFYQRMTGPTYPEKGKVKIGEVEYKYKLIRSHGGEGDATVKIEVPKEVGGTIKYRNYPGGKEWTEVVMSHDGQYLKGDLPHQPPAGKLEYTVTLSDGSGEYVLNQTPTKIRFKGGVPLGILIPHIFFMFMAMLLSTRTGLEAIFSREKTLNLAVRTTIALFIGGLILGPIVQKYAFGDLWTGWPFGGDWTDNKTIFAFIFWVIAVFVLRKNKSNRLWPIIAFIVLQGMYMIPHSMGGSELDPNTGKVVTGMKK